jgi:uncharacterized protein (DUF58 family)
LNSLNLKERFQLSRFFIGEKPTDDVVTLNHRRIFILPTKRGLGFALLLLLLLLIAFVYNNNLVYLLTFLLASIFFITILHTFKSLSGLSVQKGRTSPVFAGESAGFEIRIDNPGSSQRHHLQIKLDKTESLMLDEKSQTLMTLYSMTTKRGWHKAGTVTLSSTFPLGLFRAWSPIRFNLKTLVYPKPVHKSLPFPETASDDSRQGFSKKGVDDFYGIQDYQPGDPIKQIHWKAYAKGQGLYSKQYSGESSAEIWLDYHLAPGNTVEDRLSQLCRWVCDAEKSGIAYGFSLPGLKLAPANGSQHARKCLEALALF